MPRPRKPTEVLLLNGAFDKDPQRRREIGPKSTEPVGDPPDELNDRAKACWYEVVGEAAPGVLTSADRGTVEVVAVVRERFRRGEAAIGEVALMMRGLTDLGMTPASRSKVSAATPEKPAAAAPWAFLASGEGKGADAN